MTRALVLTLVFGLATSGSGAAHARTKPRRGGDGVNFWESMVNPHGKEIEEILADARRYRDTAGQVPDPHQTMERQRLYGQAVERGQQALALAPDRADLLLEAGQVAFSAGEWEISLGMLQHYREVVPDDAQHGVIYQIAVDQLRLRRYQDAERTCEAELGSDTTTSGPRCSTRASCTEARGPSAARPAASPWPPRSVSPPPRQIGRPAHSRDSPLSPDRYRAFSHSSHAPASRPIALPDYHAGRRAFT
jgi:hypothetical protein